MNCENIVETAGGKLMIVEVVHKGCLKPIKVNGVMCQCRNITKCLRMVKGENEYKERADFYNMVNEVAYDERKNYPESIHDGRIKEFDPEVYLNYMGMSSLFDEKKGYSRDIEIIRLNCEYIKLSGRKRGRRVVQQISQQLLEAIKDGNIPTVTIETAKERIKREIEKLGGNILTISFKEKE